MYARARTDTKLTYKFHTVMLTYAQCTLIRSVPFLFLGVTHSLN